MFESDLLVAFAFMAVLFLRQIVILKRPNKLNYAPLMIGIGAIATLVHFILHPDTSNVILLFRESLFPLLVSLLLYIVMNIMHQTQLSENARHQEEFSKVLVQELSQLKAFILEIEEKMNRAQEEERISQAEIRVKFKDDIKALDTIQANQNKFIDKFDEMEAWHKDVTKGFEHFREVQLPELDNVVHKHIDILRVAEQDHYNKLNGLLQHAVESRGDISEDIEELKESIKGMKNLSKDIANSITKHTLAQLSGVTKAFESQLILLKTHTEGVNTSLHESETTLSSIRTQSEIIMKQMVLSSDKMQELQDKNSSLHDVYSTLTEVIQDIEAVKSDYVKAQAQLGVIVNDLSTTKDEQLRAMQKEIETLSESLAIKIDESLEKLHEHYNIADGEITQSVQILAKRAKLKSGYGEFESKD